MCCIIERTRKSISRVKESYKESIRCGLAEEYNYPVIQQMDIVWEKYQNISLYLRNMDYSTIYDEIEKIIIIMLNCQMAVSYS